MSSALKVFFLMESGQEEKWKVQIIEKKKNDEMKEREYEAI